MREELLVNTETSLSSRPAFMDQMIGNRAKLWKTLGGGILILVIWQLTIAVIALLYPPLKNMVMGGPTAVDTKTEVMGALALTIGGFGPAFLLLLAWRKGVEQAPIAGLFTAQPRFRWSLAAAAALTMSVFAMVSSALVDRDSLAPLNDRLARLTGQEWALMVTAFAIGFGVQATFEEVFVRGWLSQHVRRFVPWTFMVILVTSAIFSLLHFGHSGWATYVVTFAFGILFGYSAWRLNGLEAAIGAHVANNFMSALVMGTLVSGNPAAMSVSEALAYGLYLAGFVGLVEVWARFGPDRRRSD
ncbi:hypothetical protein PbB2_01777 [Candidatus Phycosocius bacilliformis]|uniref:CAAX prenyl protease 2/Lysostaphin resistance protein A-like domain-containing protein n=1 Tax=Candidatus Phycosocius bacilliformis TaxID=1445552 RepID=A0A2P2EAJ8_9PROT|nr:CPBP family intramembrane glutamic endopeptidase [Candidatus Phycosocius bacilliformis]GBF58106.1 hypothetical protein PbB2_01777 [Candidatus Phycosocius bacilliformis]